MRPHPFWLAIALTACGTAPHKVGGMGQKAPNVIVVMPDDQGWGDFTMHGNPVLATPHLDALAAESMQVSTFYVHPVCTPTRAALMTGRHPQRTKAIDTYVGRAMLEPEEVTIAEALGDAGWETGIFGKWHLGDCAPMRPQDQGFDRAVVHKGGGIGQPSDPLGGERKYTDPVLLDQGQEQAFEGYCTDIYFDQAMQWMHQQAEQDQRFFCYIAPNAPHTPLHDVPEGLYDKYRAMDLSVERFRGGPGHGPAAIKPDQLARLYAMIENIDENMGRLVEFLGQEGLERDTLLVFLCDNGPQGRRYNEGLRSAKGSVYEGGVRSPLFVRWPAALAKGEVQDEIGAHLDLFPTILDACGVDVPAEVELDGRSLLPALAGQPAGPAPSPLVIQWHRGDVPVQGHHVFVRDGKWKLINHPAPWNELEQPPPWQPELYDLEQDPYEQNNVASEFSQVVERLSQAYRDWFADVAPNAGPQGTYYWLPPPIRIGGEGAERVVLTRQDWRRDDGRGWGKAGSWRVLFTDGGMGADEADVRPWKVRVVFPRGAKPQKVKLGINSGSWTYITWEEDVEKGAKEVTLENVQRAWFGSQPASVNCELIDANGDKTGPHQLIFYR